MEIKFNEFELLTLREGLFSLKNTPRFDNGNKPIINEEEFRQIDDKIKLLVEELPIKELKL